MLRFLLLNLLCVSFAFSQTPSSTIRGTITDRDTGLPLVSATISLPSTGQGALSDQEGNFRFDNLPIGRYRVVVSYVGYETLFMNEVLLEAAREQVLPVKLAPSGMQLESAEVQGERALAVNSVQAITPEQTLRYAATYMDPARVAASFPGVAVANDQANGLVIRGNNPSSMQWRLEGVEIVNPNHLSNAGNQSDRPTATGGGVNILSTQLLATSHLYTGAFPAQFGNALSGVMDMKFRNGNNEKQEYTLQASLIGLDLAAEGPFSEKSKASYLVNYRYSFTGLLANMGVQLGGEDNRFQDLSFKVNLPTERAGEFSFFGMGGISSNVFTAERDTTVWEIYKDQHDIDYRNKMGAAGVSHRISLGSQTTIYSAFVGSGLVAERESYLLNKNDLNQRLFKDRDEIGKSIWSLTSNLTRRLGSRSRWKAGFFINRKSDRLYSQSSFMDILDKSMSEVLLQPYTSFQHQLSAKFSSEVGLNYSYYSSTSSHSVEPRASIKWQTNPRRSLSFSYGLHSQAPSAAVYFSKERTEFPTSIPIERPKPTKGHHLVLGYQEILRNNGIFKVEGYLQHFFQVPIGTIWSDGIGEELTFSALNSIDYVVNMGLANKGTGRNYGIELSYQKFLEKDYYLMIAGSLYSSTYKALDGKRYSTRYDGRHTFSFTGGKEYKVGQNTTWGINTKILWLGGFRESTNNFEPFSTQLKDYFRPDLRIYWKKSRSKYNRTVALDIQNVSNTKNEAYSYFDTLQRKTAMQYQLGTIPVLSYRIEF
jgi:hypothetical protein